MLLEDEAPPAATTETPLPVRVKLGWGVGGLCTSLMAGGFPALLNPIFNIALRLDATTLGWIASAPRFLDAAYDIWLGHLSDNAATRWGRRRPFIFAGAIAVAVCYAAVWWVPVGWSPRGQLAFFAVTSTMYWLAFSTYTIPFNALGYELSGEPKERTSVQAYGQFAGQLGGLGVTTLFFLCFHWPFAGTGAGGVPIELTGARRVTLIVAAVALLSGLATALFTRERPAVAARVRVPLVTAVRLAFTDRAFLHFIAMIVVTITGVTIASGLGLYVTIYHVFAGDRPAAAKLMSVSGLLVTSFSLTFTLVLPAAARTVGKKGLLVVGQLLLIGMGLAGWWLYTPRHPYWVVGPAVLGAAGMNCIQVLYGSFLGDICDADDLRNGTRQEGIYSAAASFVNKLNYAAQAGLNGMVLGLVGFSAKLHVQSAHTVWLMRAVFAAAPVTFAALGIGLAVTFPITARRAAETKRLLDARRTADVV